MAIGQERDVMLAGRGMDQSEPMSTEPRRAQALPRLGFCTHTDNEQWL